MLDPDTARRWRLVRRGSPSCFVWRVTGCSPAVDRFRINWCKPHCSDWRSSCSKPRFDLVFLRDGQHRRSVPEGLLALPLGLLLGLATAWISYGALKLPALSLAMILIANNLFFPAVEESEFRGFLLSWLSRRKIPSMLAVFLVAVLHTLAHPHYLWSGNYVSALAVFLVGLWWGDLTLRTHSLWSAYVVHALFNIFYFLPWLGAGITR